MKNQFSSRYSLFRYAWGIMMLISLLLSVSSCDNSRKDEKVMVGRTLKDTTSYKLHMPNIPSNITSSEERAEFLAFHYWDNMDWNDTILLKAERFMGENMATYGTILEMVPYKTAVSAVSGLINEVADNKHALRSIDEYAFSYFYYPGAPQYNEELYLLFINPLLAQSNFAEADAERLKMRKEYIHKNRVGSIAADFSFIGTDGKEHTLLKTSQEAAYRILMLYDPECEVCEDAIRIMSEAKAFTEAQKSGEVSVIAINAYGQPNGGEADRKDGMPQNWVVGYSPEGEIENEEIYAIRATPAIYVLDKDGRILMKDLSIARLSQFVNSTE